MGRPKKVISEDGIEEEIIDETEEETPVDTRKEDLLALYQTLKDLGINSIGDLEVKISRL